MTTEANDDLEQRLIREGKGFVDKQGVDPLGFKDPSGQYPKTEYENSSSLNFTARGVESPQLVYGGGIGGKSIPGIPASSLAALPSTYPHVQVKVSQSGHIIELNDTPGGERILIRHNNGSGVEIRPDGTVIVSSTHNRIEVCGGDNSVIVEGDAHLTYKGNLTLNVTGDYDIDCLNHNVNVRGNKTETIAGSNKTKTSGSSANTTSGNRSETTAGTKTQTQLGDHTVVTKGKSRAITEGDVEVLSGASMVQTAEKDFVMSSLDMNIAATKLSVFGDSGTIGGENIVMYNYNMHTQNTVWSTTIDTNVVYGDLQGTAEFAKLADVTNSQNYSDPDTDPGSDGNTGTATGFTVNGTAVDTLATALPTSALLTSYLGQSSKGIRDVTVDPGDYMKNGIIHPPLPPIQARGALRDLANRLNPSFIAKQVGAGTIAGFGDPNPKALGRSRSATATPLRGRTPIGNIDMTNSAAPFLMPSFATIMLPDAKFNVNLLTAITQTTKLSEGISLSKFLVDKGLDASLTLDNKRQLARNYLAHTQFIKTVSTKPQRDRRSPFENLRLEVLEGYFRPISDETVTSGSVLSLRTKGNAVTYRLVNQDGDIDLDATFELATLWKNSMSFDKLILDYDHYSPDGKLHAAIIVIVPDIPETYRTTFKRSVETIYNNKNQGVGLLEVLE